MIVTPRSYWKILKTNMADASADAGGSTQEEGLEMTETQRKMSEPAQPVNNHNAQAQKTEATKKSLKKKGWNKILNKMFLF